MVATWAVVAIVLALARPRGLGVVCAPGEPWSAGSPRPPPRRATWPACTRSPPRLVPAVALHVELIIPDGSLRQPGRRNLAVAAYGVAAITGLAMAAAGRVPSVPVVAAATVLALLVGLPAAHQDLSPLGGARSAAAPARRIRGRGHHRGRPGRGHAQHPRRLARRGRRGRRRHHRPGPPGPRGRHHTASPVGWTGCWCTPCRPPGSPQSSWRCTSSSSSGSAAPPTTTSATSSCSRCSPPPSPRSPTCRRGSALWRRRTGWCTASGSPPTRSSAAGEAGSPS